jgi:hypothetical protein
MDQPERVRYFDQQFLRVEDFTAEQDYHRDMRRRHNRMMHTPGIAEGLLLVADGTGVKITPGSAIPAGTDVNGGGAEIVLGVERRQELSSFAAGADVFVTVTFAQEPTRFRDDAGVKDNTRWREAPVIEAFTSDPTATPPADPAQPLRILLGRVLRGGAGGKQVVNIDGTGRRLAGAAQSEVSLTPRDPAVTEPDWVRLRWLARGEGELRGSLRIQPGGPTPGNLAVAGAVTTGGRIGVGTPAPAQALHVTGNAQVNTAFVGDVGHGAGWTGFSHKDAVGTASYGFLHSGDGRSTLINKRSGPGAIEFRVDNNTRLSMDDAGNAVLSGTLTAGAVNAGSATLSAGGVLNGVAIGRDPVGVDYQFEYETVGAGASNFNLRLQSPNSIILHTAGAERLYVDPGGAVRIAGDLAASVKLTVGAGANGRMRVRHIDGKHHQTDDYDGLFLNWDSGQPVTIGGGAGQTDLFVNGNMRARNFPADDATSALTTVGLVTRGPNGRENTWNIYTAAVGGGFGVKPGAFEIWQYPPTAVRFQIDVDGSTRLCPNEGNVYIGGNKDGPFMALHDDLWFYDPQNATIQIRNSAITGWGTLVGIFSNQSSARYKAGIRRLDEAELATLLDDATATEVVRYQYRGNDEETGRERVGVVSEQCPPYLLAVDGESIVVMEYAAMLHGALQVLADKVRRLEEER